MKSRFSSALLGVIIACATFPAETRAEQPGMLSLSPVTDHGAVATRVDLDSEQSLLGLRWYHNDGTVQFPSLLLLEAVEDDPPDLTNTGLILANLSAEELSWGQVTFPFPLISSTTSIFAVFVFPPNVETTGLGDGGGPALGLAEGDSGLPFWISANGSAWVQASVSTTIAVEPVVGSQTAKAAREPHVLSELAKDCEYDWAGAHEGDLLVIPIARTQLFAPYPNPFNPRTTIRFDMATDGKVQLDVFDVRGRRVRTLVLEDRKSGHYSVIWDGTDQNARRVASGVYFVQMELASERYSKRMTLVR